MGNQRPPGGPDEPTLEPQRPQGGGTPPRAWVDPNRTQRYPDRRSIADRLRNESREPDPPPPYPAEDDTTAAAKPPGTPPPKVAPARPPRVAFKKRSGGGRLIALIAVVVAVGLGGGAAAAWFSGWRPPFLGAASGPEKPVPEKPAAQPTDPKPGQPGTPTAPPGNEVGRNCFGAITEVKAGAGACGFALDAQGALSFQGARLGELKAGAGPAQRVTLYPFSPSGRFVFLRACDAPSGGSCPAQRLADTKEKKLAEVTGAAGFGWVAWSPKEQTGLLGYRAGASDTIAVVHLSSGEVLKASAIRVARNRYALVKADSIRWGRDEQSFSVEVKLCPMKGRERNTDCEQDEDVKFRRRTVKFEP